MHEPSQTSARPGPAAPVRIPAATLLAIGFCVGGAGLFLGYSLITGHLWEDFFITFAFSQNLAEGRGLVYGPGVRIHGFTSPLGVLLPALSHWLSGLRSCHAAAWTYRLLFCLPAYLGGGLLLLRLFRDIHPGRLWPAAAVGILYLLDPKGLLFATNGMETAFMLLFLAASLPALQHGIDTCWRGTGAAWAGLMWTRPDACIYVAALMLAQMLDSPHPRRTAMAIGKAALVTTLLYLPWLAWSWWYYGALVPHTITAKAASLQSGAGADWAARLGQAGGKSGWVFGPVYPYFREWPLAITLAVYAAAAIAAVYWAVPRVQDRFGRRISLVFFLVFLYLALMPFPFPWYFPPAAMLASVVLAQAAVQLAARLAPRWQRLPAAALVLFMAALGWLGILTTRQMQCQQALIEDGVRRPIGEWLRQHHQPGDRVFLECVGYIGYFSGMRVLDFPGLVSPDVVRLVKEKDANFVSVVPLLDPEWLVLRPHECAVMAKADFFARDYRPVVEFDARDRLAGRWIPGQSYLAYDARFIVFQRQASIPDTTTP
jgi:hypothetical protein